MTKEELDFIGSMNMHDEISNEAYKKIVCHCEEQEPSVQPCEDCDYSEIMDWEQDTKTGKAKPIYWCERHKEPCDDAISRQAVKDQMIKYGFHSPDMTVTEFVEGLPSVNPQPKWIPVSERLPEKPNVYTVTDSKGDVVRFVFNDTESSREYWLRCAKAWMFIEPYIEDGETE